MKDLNNQVWVTSALTNDEVRSALVLCFSLKRACTTRRVAVIASPEISRNWREKLSGAFDMVFFVEEDQNLADLKLEDFAKLSCLSVLRAFEKAAFVSPTMLAMKNADDIFGKLDDQEMKTFGNFVLSHDMDLRVLLFKPSWNLYKKVTEGLQHAKNGKPADLRLFFKLWTKEQLRQGNTVKTLDGKYSRMLQKGKMLLGNAKDISIVDFSDVDPLALESKGLKGLGLLGKCAIDHWLKLHSEFVQPLMDAQNSLIDVFPKKIPSYSKEPIAIVGMSCRFPSAKNTEEFWSLLFAGEDGTCKPPPFRWLREHCSQYRSDCMKTNAGFLSVPVDEFDAKFFGVSPKEVLFMDPQHRLLHELVWEGLEDACIDPHALKGTPGSVFIGSWLNDYKDILAASGNNEFYRTYMGNSIGAAAARISHLLELVGPSVATESGCSSAMVAVHLACRSLQCGETNMALACGVNILLHPFDKDVMPMVISPDGHCKTFCEKANGFARGEGAGVLVLKRLSDAVKDGDNIWALIRGSAFSQEGVSKSMGTPTVHCESLAMSGALKDADVSPEDVSYVEAHGTGTVVGDPMEVAAIAKAYHSRHREEPLMIGSVKTNVGHTESCSGITGIMKVVLAMHHEIIPAHRNFEKLNPSIDLDKIPAEIPLERVEWKRRDGKPRLAGVSSFGITGTDAHVILEESPEDLCDNAVKLESQFERPLHVLKISAKSEEALTILLERYTDAISSTHSGIEDIVYAGNVGRANFNHRAVIIAQSKDKLVDNIQQNKFLRGEVLSEEPPKICFLFTGQGCQYPGMAKNLYQTSPIFRMYFDFCAGILKETYHIDIEKVLWGNVTDEISRTIYSQTSIFCVEYALLKLWESWGVKPDYALGHSLGEFAAAVCAGILTVEHALKLVAERSRLIDQLPRGKMLVTKADQQKVDTAMKRFGKRLNYAAINSSEQTVVAGDSDDVLGFSNFCTNNGIKSIILEATHAFHSSHMDPMLEEYRQIASTLEQPVSTKCEYISGMNGCAMSPKHVNADYWVQHTRQKVLFLEASKEAVKVGCSIFIEIGPQPVLSALTMMNNDDNLLCLPSLRKTEEEWTTLLNSIAKLYIKGISIDWEGLDRFHRRIKVRLPHYPFVGKKFWPDMMALTGATIHPLLGSPIANASSTKIYQCGINLAAHEFVKDHAIGENVIFPGAGYLEMCLAAGLATVENSIDSLGKPTRSMKVEDLRIEAPLALLQGKTSQVQTVVNLNTMSSSADWNDMSVKIFHRVDSESSAPSWLSHANATFSPLLSAEEQQTSFDLSAFQARRAQESNDNLVSQVYEKLASIGLKFGPIFRSLEKVWKTEQDSTLLARVKTPLQDQGQSQYIIHPAVLDAMIQSIMMLRLTGNLRKKLYVPIKIGKFLWLADNETEDTYIYAYDIKPHGKGDELKTQNCTALLLDGQGKVLATMSDVEFIDTTVKTIEAVLEQQTVSMPDLWEEVWRPATGPMQDRQNLKLCNGEKFYDEDFRQDMLDKYNNLEQDRQDTLKRLDKLVYNCILRAMIERGWTAPAINTVFSGEELANELGIQKEYRHIFGYYLEVLQEEGLLKREEGDSNSWEIVAKFNTLDTIAWELTDETVRDLSKKFHVTLLFSKVGENLSQILSGKLSPLHFLFPEDSQKKHPSAGDFYEEYGKLFKFWDLGREITERWLSSCNGHQVGRKYVMRILEIGAGTGGLTSALLHSLDELGIEFEYTYTDISAAFFPAAEKRFSKWGRAIRFKKLNIEEDPISQGFVPEYYDYVCAYDVIHATRDIRETLENVRTLLKPLGRFDMLEQTRVNRFVTYLFGLLDGFWRFEDKDLRPSHCTMSVEKWKETFELSGFNVVGCFPCVNYYNSIMCTTKSTSVANTRFPQRSRKTWLIFHHEDSPISNFLLNFIPSVTNRQILLVQPGKTFSSTECGFTLRKDAEVDFNSMMEALGRNQGSTVEGIIYCWSLDKTIAGQDEILQPYFYLAKAITSLEQSACPRIVTLTDGIVPLDDNNLEHFHPSTIWGFTKSLQNENIGLNCRVVDIGGGNENSDKMMQIFYEIWNTEKETQVAYNGAARYIPKFQPFKPSVTDLKLPSGTDRFQLILPETKSIADLQFGPLEPVVLGNQEVGVQVKASALNFRDVFSVLKPTEQFKNVNAVGFDLAGVVKRVGPMVTRWAVGDNVFGINMHGNGLPSHVNLDENDLLPVKEGMTFCEAATLPAVFATSYYCLIEVAKVTSTDTVLIHTGSGGVGLSAVQLCRHMGAKVICTAGNKRKQNYLRSLGIEHIFHSRNTNYGKEILKLTGGRGVDVVLNSLTSEGFKEATLMACAKGARFVEMSKLSIWQPEEVKKLRPDVDYTIVDISAMSQSELRKLMDNVKKLVDEKVVQPIPFVRFDALNIREALQYLQKAKHIGKVVCVMPEVKQRNGQTVIDTPMFNPISSYLITGGLGGIGFEVCQWMVQKGARYVLLAGRNLPKDTVVQSIAKLNSQFNAKITPVQLDVSNFEQCKQLIQHQIREMGFPHLRGIMHCAGTLHDGLIQNQDWTSFSSTLSSKVDGTMNLHELTKGSRLEHFVLFSSIATLFGSPGQCNHAAGNNFEDTFAHYRNSVGLPATTINWGQWGQVGVATEVDLPGLKPFSTLQGISGLEFALKSQRTQTCVVNIESFVLLSKLFPHITSYLDERVWKSSCGASSSFVVKSSEFWEQYDTKGDDMEKKLQLVQESLRTILKNTLKLDAADIIHDDQNFQELGVDSLMFVEIKNALQSLLGDRVTVNASVLRDCNNVKFLSEILLKLIEGDETVEDDSQPPNREEVAALIREDCELPEHIRAKEGQKLVAERDIKCILVTGCTGTLGPYMIKELSSLPQILDVICLVRSNNRQSGEERLRGILEERDLGKEIDMTKVSVVNGDVAFPMLGLLPEVWDELCDKVEAIFHCAASVNHTEHYRKQRFARRNDMRAVNIGGTKNVLEFSSSGRILKHIFFTSSLVAVPKVDRDGILSEEWPEVDDFDGVLTLAYPIMKFVGEVLIKKAVLERGIPGKVIRYPFIVGDSSTGSFVLNQNHVMMRYLFIMKTGIMPSNPFPVAFVPVDVCAKVGVKLFLDGRLKNNVINLTHNRPDTDQEFVQVAKRLGYNVDIVEFSEFAQKIRDSSAEDSPFAIFKEFYRNDEDMMGHYATNPALRQWFLEGGNEDSKLLHSRKISNLIPDFYERLEGCMECIQRDLLFARKQGWLQKYNLS